MACAERPDGKMIEIGRLCVKTAGRDAGLKCIIIDIIDNNYVLIDGQTRRRKCNILHLEPLKEVIDVRKNASHENIREEFKKLSLEARETKPKQKTEKQKRKRKTPEQLRQQKDEKKKLRDVFKIKKKEEKKPAKEESLEAKAGLIEEKEEHEHKEHHKAEKKAEHKDESKTAKKK